MALEIARGMDPDKFAKVLALVESDHHGEAQSALRAARIMLARAGLTFRDLADMARQPDWTPPQQVTAAPPPSPPAPVVTTAGDEMLRSQVRVLELRIRELETSLDRQQSELARQRLETKRWHELARETAEKLWDVGQALETNQTQVKAVDKRRSLIETLRDPATAELSDREIARRIGTTTHAVGYWRRRLAVADRTRLLAKVQPRGRQLAQRLTDSTKPDTFGNG